jgi:myo-inositol 2-dehydrogenase/D-chiro-inositol 1-dehydrogenase
VDLWREVDLPVQLGFMRRFDPGYLKAKDLIASGELGRIEQFRALSRDTNPPPLEFLLSCGGSFLDMSVHDLDLARFLVGEVEEVHAWASVLFDDRFAKADDWDTSVIMMKFRNGALGVVETARHSTWGYDIRTEVAGAVGKVIVDGGQKTPATHLRRVAAEGDLFGDFADRFEVAYKRELEVFFENLGAGRPVGPGPDDALETLRLAVACTRSWRENRPIRLDEVTA